MAQIDIEEKNDGKNKNSKGLYIIIAILAITCLIWWLSSGDNENQDEIIRPTTMEQSLPNHQLHYWT